VQRLLDPSRDAHAASAAMRFPVVQCFISVGDRGEVGLVVESLSRQSGSNADFIEKTTNLQKEEKRRKERAEASAKINT
jgi:hypothetical protein